MVVFALYEKAHSQRMMNIPKKPLTMIPSLASMQRCQLGGRTCALG